MNIIGNVVIGIGNHKVFLRNFAVFGSADIPDRNSSFDFTGMISRFLPFNLVLRYGISTAVFRVSGAVQRTQLFLEHAVPQALPGYD